MPNKVYVEPERLRKFANDLKIFRSDVNELTSRLRGNLNRLSDSWQDQEFEKFRQVFEVAQERLRKFSDEIEQTVPKIERDAQAAEDYFNVNLPNI